MLKRSSALVSAKSFTGRGLNISEAPDFALTQYAGAEKDLKKALGKIPMRVGVAQDGLLRIAPNQIIAIDLLNCHSRDGGNPTSFIEPKLDSRPRRNDGIGEVCVTPLSSSRTRIALEGENARAVLAKLSAIDFHPKQFKAGMFVQSAIHHTPALIHCLEENAFHIYAMRTFGLSVWEALTDAALEFSS
jgi:Sarcosine oxidase, gamma subunit family